GSGLLHARISLTAERINHLREQIDANADPWYTYAKQTAQSELPALEFVPRNRDEDDPTLPRLAGLASQGDNSLFISDGLLAYTQAVMFLLTGLPEHRANALEVISLWAQSDPGAFEYVEDSHTHTGVPMQRMTTAAEILRHTSGGRLLGVDRPAHRELLVPIRPSRRRDVHERQQPLHEPAHLSSAGSHRRGDLPRRHGAV